MKKTFITTLILAILTVPLSANAFDFRNFLKSSLLSSDNSTQKVTNQSNPFEVLDAQISNANIQTQNTFLDIVSILSSTQETQNIKSKFISIMNNKLTSGTEKSSLVSQIISDYAISLLTNKTDFINTIKNMSVQEQKGLAEKISKFAKNGNSYLELAKNYAKATANSSNMQNLANNIISAKQTAETLNNNAQAIVSLVSNVSALLKQSKS